MAPSAMLEFVVQLLEQLDIPYMITGSVASSAYGEPRFTNDIDIVIDLPDRLLGAFVRGFPDNDFYISEPAVREALRSQSMFNVIHPASGMKVDFIVRKPDEFDQMRFDRRIRLQSSDGTNAMFSSPEDVILKKLEFFREGQSEKHLRDIASIMRISYDQLDTDYIQRWAVRLQVDDTWNEIVRAVDERERKPDH